MQENEAKVTQADSDMTQAFYASCDASMTVDDQEMLDRHFARHRQQAEDAMRERCAVIADNHRHARISAAKNAHDRKAKPEARDHESMAIEAMHIATAIRAATLSKEGG